MKKNKEDEAGKGESPQNLDQREKISPQDEEDQKLK